jgi:WD40 repeat protein
MWDLSDYSVKAMMTGPSKATCCINLGDQILSGWTDGFIRMYDIKSQTMKWQINAHRGGVTCLAHCNKFICSGGEDSIIRLWSTVNQELIAQYSEHTKPVTDILIDIDHPHLLHSCSIDKTVSTFDLKIGRRITFHALQKHNDRGFMSISQRLDHEKEVVTAGIDGKIRFWDIDYPNQVDILEDTNSCLNTIAVSPSGRFIAVGGDDALVKVWNLQTKKIISVGVCHSSKVNCVKWSPDEKQLISVGE